MSNPLNPFNIVWLWLEPFSVGNWVGGVLVPLGNFNWNWFWLNPFKSLILDWLWLNPDSVWDCVGGILKPLGGGDWVGLWLDPFDFFDGKWFLWNVFNPRAGEWFLSNVFNPWAGKWFLGNIFEISVFHWWWLEDLHVLNWVGWWDDSLNLLVGDVVDLIISIINDSSVIIEWVVVVEIGIADSWVLPSWLNNSCWLNNNNIVVWVVVHEVPVVQVSGSDTHTNLSDGWVLSKDWEVIVRVGVIVVGIGNSGVWMSDWCFDSSVHKDWVVIVWVVIKVVKV